MVRIFATINSCSSIIRLGVLLKRCHGNDGRGDPARLIPGLAGQPPGYLVQQMLIFKQDTRDPGEPMLAAKKALMRIVPDGQFAELAAYYSSLR